MIDWKVNEAMVPNDELLGSDEVTEMIRTVDRKMTLIKGEPFAVITMILSGRAQPEFYILASSETRGHFQLVQSNSNGLSVGKEQPRREILEQIVDGYCRTLGEFEVSVTDRKILTDKNEVFEDTEEAAYRRKLAKSSRCSTPSFIRTEK